MNRLAAFGGSPLIGPDDVAGQALTDLISAGDWRTIPAPPGAAVVIRPWPDGSVDTIATHGQDQALAERTNPHGNPVWRTSGAVLAVVAELQGLAAPGTPGAPCSVIGPAGDDVDRWI